MNNRLQEAGGEAVISQTSGLANDGFHLTLGLFLQTSTKAGFYIFKGLFKKKKKKDEYATETVYDLQNLNYLISEKR